MNDNACTSITLLASSPAAEFATNTTKVDLTGHGNAAVYNATIGPSIVESSTNKSHSDDRLPVHSTKASMANNSAALNQ